MWDRENTTNQIIHAMIQTKDVLKTSPSDNTNLDLRPVCDYTQTQTQYTPMAMALT